ncbi:MAG: N(4)-(beta-N-acetylglucosaminyl)-L-asparaginase [Fimbriimonadaceae bacterium]|nr:N(4)-(beta-N-acetylglucosaminyl)-L-asparaginase [Fimbriimonadaceae bacterium]
MSTTFLGTWEKPGQTAVRTAWSTWQSNPCLRTAIEDGLAACELDPNFLAIGLGSLPNQDGEIELDAAMMDGERMEVGAVCAMRGIVPAISVARRVMEQTPHNMLAGDQARRFALAHGMTPRNLVTEAIARQYEKWRAGQFPDEYMHSTSDLHGDTVTMLGLHQADAGPKCVAASSTSGIAWKIPGRVGDSPIVGAGLYADNEIGCAGATGLGEELWKGVASFRAVRNMEAGMSAQAACDEVVQHMIRRQPHARDLSCVVLALRNDGDFGAAITIGKFELWVCRDGEVSMQVVERD